MEEQSKQDKEDERKIMRIMSTDVPGNKNLYAGLAKIKGVSWGFSNALCKSLKLDKKRKFSSLKDDEIKKISEFIKNPKLPAWLVNRRRDRDSGNDMHLSGSDLDLRKEFDIKRLKKIRSYRGLRHSLGQPTRGQRTRSHFRKNKSVGVIKKGKVGKK